jgi:glycine/D-amino acid oxidase-like deaminating enzyme
LFRAGHQRLRRRRGHRRRGQWCTAAVRDGSGTRSSGTRTSGPAFDTEPAFSWAGCFGTSPSGLPAIGAVPGAARCFAVLGYGGNGITFSVIAAQVIQRAIMGISDPDTDLFALSG